MSFPQRQHLGDSSPDLLKSVWSVVPFAVIRLTGGKGKWTDPLTHATLTDAQSDLRKSAVVASAIGAFNDQNNFWYDNATQQHLTPAEAYNRWQQVFGDHTFAEAYGSFPAQFAVFNPTSTNGDPVMHAPGTVVVPAPVAVPVSAPPAAGVPLTSASATPQQVAAAGAGATPAAPASANTVLLLAGVGLGAYLLFAKHSPRGKVWT